MSPIRPRYVPDTNVCLDLFVFDDPHCVSLFAAARAGEIQLVTCADCRAEWQAVLTYPQLRLGEERRAQALNAFDTWVACLHPSDLAMDDAVVLPRCRDHDDQKFLELAQQAQAIALLTRDDALLRLAKRARRDGLFAILPPALWQEALSPL